MAPQYNPIVRTFGRLRAGLLDGLDVDRRAVRPDTPLELLLPVPQRRQVWRRLRRWGLRVPPLELTPRQRAWGLLGVLKPTLSLALWLQKWPALLAALPLGVFAFALLAYWASRPRAVQFPLGLTTVGELVLYLTSFPEHKGSGYRWTRNEVAFKVRLVVAEGLGLRLDEVRPESTLAELGAA